MNFKLKHIDIISSEKVDYTALMKDERGIRKYRFWQIFTFVNNFKKTMLQVEELRHIDFKNIAEVDDCKIKKPSDISLISFSAAIEIQSLFSKDNSEESIGELMAKTIAMCCFSENNYKVKFDSDSIEYKKFLEKVRNSELLSMVGLYHWIDKSFTQSDANWNKLFSDVSVPDKNYDEAGGHRMNGFKIITTIKNICRDFNVPYEESLQIPYGITQASALEAATQAHIQHLMTEIIERKMRNERKS
jgi:hypothetical protein